MSWLEQVDVQTYMFNFTSKDEFAQAFDSVFGSPDFSISISNGTRRCVLLDEKSMSVVTHSTSGTTNYITGGTVDTAKATYSEVFAYNLESSGVLAITIYKYGSIKVIIVGNNHYSPMVFANVGFFGAWCYVSGGSFAIRCANSTYYWGLTQLGSIIQPYLIPINLSGVFSNKAFMHTRMANNVGGGQFVRCNGQLAYLMGSVVIFP